MRPCALVGQSKEEVLNSYIASGEYPDFILGEKALLEADALIPIDEYWDDYPNLRNYLSDEQWEHFRQEDGHIYWIPPFCVSQGENVEVTHTGEAFWIQTRVLKWAGYPKITTVDEYFDLIEAYVQENPAMPDGTPNIPFTVLYTSNTFSNIRSSSCINSIIVLKKSQQLISQICICEHNTADCGYCQPQSVF